MSGTCLLVDYNNLCFRCFFTRDVGGAVPEAVPNFQMMKWMVIDQIYKLIVTNKDVDEVVLGVDHKNPWRKSYFPRYKEKRGEKREKDKINWELVFGVLHNFMKEIKHHLPFKVLKIQSAEADDVIAVIAKEIEKECIISSNDVDFLQLCSDRVRVWNPTKHEFTVCEDTENFIEKLVLTGQAKDGVFNVITPNEWGLTEGTTGKRKPGFGEKSAVKVMSEGVDNWIESKGTYKKFDLTVDVKKNYKRNRVLLDFNYIPQTIISRVMDTYLNYNYPPPRNIYQFFKQNRMKGFLDEFTKTENTFMRLY